MAIVFAAPALAPADEPPLTLIARLSIANDHDRETILYQLDAMLCRDADRVAVNALVRVLRKFDSSLERHLVDVLGRVAYNQPASFVGAVPDLVAVIPGLDYHARFGAIELLGYLGPRATEAAPLLRAFSAGKHRASVYERAYAAAALIRVDPNERDAIGLLCNLSASSKPYDVCTALAALTFSKSESEPVVATFREKLSHEHAAVRALAAKGLWKTGAPADEVVPLLRKSLREPGATVITRQSSHSEWQPSQRTVAAFVLAEIGGDAKEAVPDLVPLLSSVDYFEQIAAARALGRIGSAARPAMDALKKLVTDSGGALRTVATDAITRILYAES